MRDLAGGTSKSPIDGEDHIIGIEFPPVYRGLIMPANALADVKNNLVGAKHLVALRQFTDAQVGWWGHDIKPAGFTGAGGTLGPVPAEQLFIGELESPGPVHMA